MTRGRGNRQNRGMTDSDWQKLLDKTPADAELRRAYATWLRDEADDADAADCQEWLAREGKQPHEYRQPKGYQGWFWFTGGRRGRSVIPDRLWRATAMGAAVAKGQRDASEGYATRAEAEAALVEAWRKLKESGQWLP